MKGFGTKLTQLALLILLTAGCAAQSQPTEKPGQDVQQAAATTVPSEKPEARIVSTTVAITQMLDLLGIDDVVGIPSSSKTLPSRYDGVKKVGNPMSPDMEIVKSLKPTEVLSVTTLQYELEPVFKNVGVDATFLNLTSLGDMKNAIIKLGEKYDRADQAKGIVKGYDDKIADIRQKTEGRPAPTVLILLGVPGSYLVATEHSYIGDLVKLAGGVNIVQGEKVEYLASNTEYLQQANPDVILRAAHGMPEEVVKMFDEEFKKNDIWKHFNAVKNGRVYDLEESLFGTTGNLAANEALDALMGMLYP
ncbi:heme ABC transporter substrate-binding protein IsdE [Paenibacillus radicis (ex Gao et al. 2016)]|uniref:High-affinity heme uptake system protein IsdE n=1 Tax=Paenibacillus radicis (ex Gao et al. 2016) TaxID=1737354 RepID=A0A917M6K4_9BACL|nr:heme ABC transporter substrate-binding protein IsdE [Paenibacillus radicis (ex Gao et al. 2016)]GGG82165.1 heme ABC transporter substrate-binding protein IsdE [Paenibacillus radicis (ex Gao et al. 2016)]